MFLPLFAIVFKSGRRHVFGMADALTIDENYITVKDRGAVWTFKTDYILRLEKL